jgi:hypothetical protein
MALKKHFGIQTSLRVKAFSKTRLTTVLAVEALALEVMKHLRGILRYH